MGTQTCARRLVLRPVIARGTPFTGEAGDSMRSTIDVAADGDGLVIRR